jgi:phosphopentomutase
MTKMFQSTIKGTMTGIIELAGGTKRKDVWKEVDKKSHRLAVKITNEIEKQGGLKKNLPDVNGLGQ